jgi:hypothetical protein
VAVAGESLTELPQDEPIKDLIQRAVDAGSEVSKDQLRRWHRAGLLPRPRQASRGRKGSEVFYPAGTGDQLLALLDLKRRYPKSLAKVRWGLWWLGFPVPDRLARDFIVALIKRNRKIIDELVTPEGHLTEKAELVLDQVGAAKIDSGAIRRARRRVGSHEFDAFMQSLLLVGSGHTEMVKLEDLELLEHGMATDRARTDKFPSTGRPWIEGSDPRTDFEQIGDLNDPTAQLAAVDAVSDEQLRQAREAAKLFLPTIINIGGVLGDLYDPSAFGYGAYAKVFAELEGTPDGQAFITVAVLAMSAAGFAEGIESTTAQYADSERNRARHEMLAALRDAVPELAPIISNRRLVAADKDPVKAEQLQNDIAEMRQELGAEITEFFEAYFDSHPRHRELLHPSD